MARIYGSVEGILIDYQEESCGRWFQCQIKCPLTDQLYIGKFHISLLIEIEEAKGKRILVFGQRDRLEPFTIDIDSIEIFPCQSELPTVEEIIGIYEKTFLSIPSMDFCQKENVVTCKIKIKNSEKN